MTNIRFSLRSITVKNHSDIVNAGLKCFSEFDEIHRCDDLIPHFIICINYYGHETTFKDIFWAKMREYGVRSAILTILISRQVNIRTKEKVKQMYRDAHESELKKDKKARIQRSLNDDLEYFYDSLQNPERKPKVEECAGFLTKNLLKKN